MRVRISRIDVIHIDATKITRLRNKLSITNTMMSNVSTRFDGVTSRFPFVFWRTNTIISPSLDGSWSPFFCPSRKVGGLFKAIF